MTSDIVFDSSSPPPPTIEGRHVIDALAIDPQTAGDAWVRFAKTRFRLLIDRRDPVRVEKLEGAAHPLWTKQESVCISIHDKETRAQSALLLENLVDDLYCNITQIESRGGYAYRVVLVGALSVRAHDLGGGFFNFTLKQRFAIGERNE